MFLFCWFCGCGKKKGGGGVLSGLFCGWGGVFGWLMVWFCGWGFVVVVSVCIYKRKKTRGVF